MGAPFGDLRQGIWTLFECHIVLTRRRMSSTTTSFPTSQPQNSMRVRGLICSIGLVPNTSFSCLYVHFCSHYAVSRFIENRNTMTGSHCSIQVTPPIGTVCSSDPSGILSRNYSRQQKQKNPRCIEERIIPCLSGELLPQSPAFGSNTCLKSDQVQSRFCEIWIWAVARRSRAQCVQCFARLGTLHWAHRY